MSIKKKGRAKVIIEFDFNDSTKQQIEDFFEALMADATDPYDWGDGKPHWSNYTTNIEIK